MDCWARPMACGDAPDPWKQSCTGLVLVAIVCAMRKSCLMNKYCWTLLSVQQNVIPSPVSAPPSIFKVPKVPRAFSKSSPHSQIRESTLADWEPLPSVLPSCLRRTPNSHHKPTLEPGLRTWRRMLLEMGVGLFSGALWFSLKTFS